VNDEIVSIYSQLKRCERLRRRINDAEVKVALAAYRAELVRRLRAAIMRDTAPSPLIDPLPEPISASPAGRPDGSLREAGRKLLDADEASLAASPVSSLSQPRPVQGHGR
jgi:hypothetical protein